MRQLPKLEDFDIDFSNDRKPNIPLLRKCVEFVEQQSKLPTQIRNWDQEVWVRKSDNFCGTVGCVAGNIAIEDGIVDWDDPNCILENNFYNTIMNGPDGYSIDVEDWAMYRLGLSRDQAFDLFKMNNSAEDVRRVAEQIAGEKL